MRIQLIFTALLASAVATQAGVLMTHRTESSKGTEVNTTTIRVDRDRIRVDATGGEQEHIFIYRADTETMYIINPPDKSYQRMTRQDMERVMSQLGDQVAQMRKMVVIQGVRWPQGGPSA